MKRSVYITLGVMLVIVCLGVLYIFFFLDPSEKQKRNETPAAMALLPEGDHAQFTNLSGEVAPLHESFGKVLIVFSWASWCPQCGADMEALNNLAKEYPNAPVEFILLNRAEDRYAAERYLKTLPALDTVTMRLDPSDHFFGSAAGYAMPETLVYAKDGTVLLQQRGGLNQAELKDAILKALEE